MGSSSDVPGLKLHKPSVFVLSFFFFFFFFFFRIRLLIRLFKTLVMIPSLTQSIPGSCLKNVLFHAGYSEWDDSKFIVVLNFVSISSLLESNGTRPLPLCPLFLISLSSNIFCLLGW